MGWCPWKSRHRNLDTRVGSGTVRCAQGGVQRMNRLIPPTFRDLLHFSGQLALPSIPVLRFLSIYDLACALGTIPPVRWRSVGIFQPEPVAT